MYEISREQIKKYNDSNYYINEYEIKTVKNELINHICLFLLSFHKAENINNKIKEILNNSFDAGVVYNLTSYYEFTDLYLIAREEINEIIQNNVFKYKRDKNNNTDIIMDLIEFCYKHELNKMINTLNKEN